MIFVDFDDVVFNTQKFKDDLKKVFQEFGVTNEQYIKYYYDPHDTRVVRAYDPRAQVRRICAGEHFAEDSILAAVDNFMQNECMQYIFADAEEFAKNVGKDNIVIVSFGEKRMQEEKILRSGVGKFIKSIIITEDKKSDAIAQFAAANNILLNEEVYFIDDRIEQILDVKNTFPNIQTIFIKRPEGRYQEQQKNKQCDYEAHSLVEAAEIINKK